VIAQQEIERMRKRYDDEFEKEKAKVPFTLTSSRKTKRTKT